MKLQNLYGVLRRTVQLGDRGCDARPDDDHLGSDCECLKLACCFRLYASDAGAFGEANE